WNGTIFVQGTDNLTASGPPSNSRGGSGVGSAHASYTSSLSPPQVSASADVSSADFFHPAAATAHLTLDYSFLTTGPGVFTPVDLIAKGSGSGVTGGAVHQEGMFIAPVANPGSHIYESPFRDWTTNTVLTVTTNAEYRVHLDVQLVLSAAASPDQTATATLDP